MVQTHQTKSSHKAEGSSSDESQTSTSSGAEQVESASRNAAIAGNPAPGQKGQKHKMKKSKVNGKDFFTCDACSYSTSKEVSADQHEKAPI